jgi:hypothetical protein
VKALPNGFGDTEFWNLGNPGGQLSHAPTYYEKEDTALPVPCLARQTGCAGGHRPAQEAVIPSFTAKTQRRNKNEQGLSRLMRVCLWHDNMADTGLDTNPDYPQLFYTVCCIPISG